MAFRKSENRKESVTHEAKRNKETYKKRILRLVFLNAIYQTRCILFPWTVTNRITRKTFILGAEKTLNKDCDLYFVFHHLNPLSANVEYTPHDSEFTCSASQAKLLKMALVFLKENCYKMVYTLCLS